MLDCNGEGALGAALELEDVATIAGQPGQLPVAELNARAGLVEKAAGAFEPPASDRSVPQPRPVELAQQGADARRGGAGAQIAEQEERLLPQVARLVQPVID